VTDEGGDDRNHIISSTNGGDVDTAWARVGEEDEENSIMLTDSKVSELFSSFSGEFKPRTMGNGGVSYPGKGGESLSEGQIGITMDKEIETMAHSLQERKRELNVLQEQLLEERKLRRKDRHLWRQQEALRQQHEAHIRYIQNQEQLLQKNPLFLHERMEHHSSSEDSASIFEELASDVEDHSKILSPTSAGDRNGKNFGRHSVRSDTSYTNSLLDVSSCSSSVSEDDDLTAYGITSERDNHTNTSKGGLAVTATQREYNGRAGTRVSCSKRSKAGFPTEGHERQPYYQIPAERNRDAGDDKREEGYDDYLQNEVKSLQKNPPFLHEKIGRQSSSEDSASIFDELASDVEENSKSEILTPTNARDGIGMNFFRRSGGSDVSYTKSLLDVYGSNSNDSSCSSSNSVNSCNDRNAYGIISERNNDKNKGGPAVTATQIERGNGRAGSRVDCNKRSKAGVPTEGYGRRPYHQISNGRNRDAGDEKREDINDRVYNDPTAVSNDGTRDSAVKSPSVPKIQRHSSHVDRDKVSVDMRPERLKQKVDSRRFIIANMIFTE